MSDDDVRKVVVVDSDPKTHVLLQQTLGGRFSIHSAYSTDDGVRMAADISPCMIIAATQGESLDGYTLCRRIKEEIEDQDIPVILITDGDSAEARLRGFDAGAEACVPQPIEAKTLAAHLAGVLKTQKKRDRLKEHVRDASMFALTAMTSLSETGLVIEGVKQLNQCITPEQLARTTLKCAAMFDLNGAVELMLGEESLVLNASGPATELERSILQQLSSMDRITQFKNRLFIRYPHVRIVINNLPTADSERCGRLRDYLSMLIEAVDVRAAGLTHAAESHSRGDVISSTIQTLTSTLIGIDVLQRQSRATAVTIRAEVLMHMEHALSTYGLSEEQENSLLRIMHQGLEALADFQLVEAHLQDELSGSIAELQRAVAASS